MKKVMLIYPPGKLYQRGEDRSQGNVEDSTATSIRACNDLGYAASALQGRGYSVLLRDYQTERLSHDRLIHDFKEYSPDLLFVSITNATIFTDLQIINQLAREKETLTVILKGALFFAPEQEMLDQLDLQNIDYLIGGESDFIIGDLVDTHFNVPERIADINGILYKEDGTWKSTDFTAFASDLDSLHFPDRGLMNNALYVRPDTGEPQATIATSRGCSAACIYCLTPKISGTRIRLRSPENIVAEMQECFFQHQIRNFFFKSDTFTLKKDWVRELCEKITASDLNGNVYWVANSRVRPLDRETLHIMAAAGCWLIAFGFESGSPETLTKIKKGASREDNLKAAEYAKEAGLKIFGFYMIGFPWEDMTHLQQTEEMIFRINADFLELHLAIPYYGTPLYRLAREEGLITESILGRDYFNPPMIGTKHLNYDELIKFRKRLLLRYHLRPSFFVKKARESLQNFRIFKNYLAYGKRLFLHNIR